MKLKRRMLAFAFALMMGGAALPPAASAADLDRSAYVIASGTVAASAFEDVLAPFSGTLLSFDWETGDRVSAGESLFRLRTQTVRAPQAGVLTAVFGEEGQDASSVLSRYGALAALEPERGYLISASTAGAYNKSKNRELHIGETLYFKSTAEGREEGSGTVVACSGETYTVEIREGSFDTREKLNLFRNDNYAAAEKVGSGTVFRRDPLLITGAGRIARVFAQAGDTVAADDPLFELLSPDADPGASDEILSPGEGVITLLAVQPGQQVWKGALMVRVSRTDQLEVIAEVDEMDLSRISVGSVCPVVPDMNESSVLQGRVTEISALGVTRQNAAWYRVHLALEGSALPPLGASVSVYLPK